MENPDLIRMIVLRSGTLIGLKGLISWGGQDCPISMLGPILQWKYPQKNLVKNKTSDIMNKIIPILIPSITFVTWRPSLFASMDVFFHQLAEIYTSKRAKIALEVFVVFTYMLKIVKSIILYIIIDDIKGQGFIDTLWNGLNLFIIFIFFRCDIMK